MFRPSCWSIIGTGVGGSGGEFISGDSGREGCSAVAKRFPVSECQTCRDRNT